MHECPSSTINSTEQMSQVSAEKQATHHVTAASQVPRPDACMNTVGHKQHLKQIRKVQWLTAGAFLFCCLLLPAVVSAVVDLSRIGEDVAPAPMVAPDKPGREPVMRESSLGPVVCKLLPEVMSLRGTRPSEWGGHAEAPSPATPLVPEGCANAWRSWCISGPQEEGRCRPKLVGTWRAVRMAVTGG